MRRVGRAVVASLCVLAACATPALPATFRWASDADLVSLDPYASEATLQTSFLANIYEPLVARDETLRLVPALATEWHVVAPDAWRFALRPGVRFADGSPFSADDVVFSLARVRGAGSRLAPAVARIREVRKLDDYTVDLLTDGPDPTLPQTIARWAIMSSVWCEKNEAQSPSEEGYAATHAAGTGPFRIRERVPDERTVLEPNADWWAKARSDLAEAVFEPIADDGTRVHKLLAGELDMIDAVPPQAIHRIERTPGLGIIAGTELRTIFLGFNQSNDALTGLPDRNPFKDRRVREAVYRAIDEGVIRDKVMGGLAFPAGMLIAPGVNGYDPALDGRLPYDPDAARRLLAAAGYPKGFATSMDCPSDRYVNDEAICTEVAAMLDKVGIKLDLLAQTRSKFFARILDPKTPPSLYLFGWTPSTYDAQNMLAHLAETRDPAVHAGEFNFGGYSNPALDRLIRRIAVETDLNRRDGLLKEALLTLRDDIAYVPLHRQALVWAASSRVELAQRADGSFPLRYVRIK